MIVFSLLVDFKDFIQATNLQILNEYELGDFKIYFFQETRNELDTCLPLGKQTTNIF